MSSIVSSLWLWIWHLVPANPILVRVVNGASKRSRHLWLRVAYLSTLLGVVIISLAVSLSGRGGSLTELAKGASQTFKYASYAQLALICFLAPVFTAAAITQERDARTFHILLSTPLTSAQIVLGSLMSRLYFVLMLLIAGLPIFLITMVYGGITSGQVFESFALSASTGLLTGALAILVAMVRVGTRGTIFSFYLLIGLYLLIVYLLGQWSATWVSVAPANVEGQRMSFLAPLHPFLALDVAIHRLEAPGIGALNGYSRLARFGLAFPSLAYVGWTSALAAMLILLSVFFVRRTAKTGERTLGDRLWQGFRRANGERRRAPRNVWNNPVAWREARTRAAGGGLLRWVLILAGLTGSLYLLVSHVQGAMSADAVRPWLAAWIVTQFAVALIIATNTAATSMTKEKESRTMDLLLTTPLSSKYILWGKLRGLVSFAVPLLAGPVVILLAFGLYGLRGGATVPAVPFEIGLEIATLTVVYTACACVLGLRLSLIARTNVMAVMYSLGLVILLCGASSLLGFTIVDASGGDVGAFCAPFSPFSAVWYLVDLGALFDTPKSLAEQLAPARVAAMFGSIAAALLYTFIVWSIYLNLVRNFDMIVRKQSGTF